MHEYRQFIQQQLDERGWKAAEFVRKSGLSRQLISSILRDKREHLGQMPEESTLEGIAKGFDIPVERVRLAAARSLIGYIDDGAALSLSLQGVHIDALLNELKRRITAAAGSHIEQASAQTQTVHYTVLRYNPAEPDTVVQDSIEAADAADARRQLDRALALSGVTIDPHSDGLITVIRHEQGTSLIGISRDDPQREERLLERMRSRAIDLQRGATPPEDDAQRHSSAAPVLSLQLGPEGDPDPPPVTEDLAEAARRGASDGRRLRDEQDAAAEIPDPPTRDDPHSETL